MFSTYHPIPLLSIAVGPFVRMRAAFQKYFYVSKRKTDFALTVEIGSELWTHRSEIALGGIIYVYTQNIKSAGEIVGIHNIRLYCSFPKAAQVRTQNFKCSNSSVTHLSLVLDTSFGRVSSLCSLHSVFSLVMTWERCFRRFVRTCVYIWQNWCLSKW